MHHASWITGATFFEIAIYRFDCRLHKFHFTKFSATQKLIDPLNHAILKTGNGNEYSGSSLQTIDYIEPTRVYRNVLKFVHGNNEYSDGNFGILFSFVYFDLTNQKLDIKDETTYKLTFKYELSGTTTTDYSNFALTFLSKILNCRKTDGKIIHRT